MITEKAPGKLYIAGEYAVLEQDCPAVLVAVNQFVRVSITKSKTSTGLIHSKQYSQDSIHWVRRGSKMVIDNRDNPFEYILSAISFTEQYCIEQNIKMKVYDLHVNSDLDSADGKKYGLGSSAAVTVATVKAILHFYGVKRVMSLFTSFQPSLTIPFRAMAPQEISLLVSMVVGLLTKPLIKLG